MLWHQGSWKTAQKDWNARGTGSGMGTSNGEPDSGKIDQILYGWDAPSSAWRPDCSLYGWNLEAFQKMGRNPDRHHPERKGPSCFQGSGEYLWKLWFHLYAQPGSRGQTDPCKAVKYQPSPAFVCNTFGRRWRAFILWKCDPSIRGQILEYQERKSSHIHRCRGKSRYQRKRYCKILFFPWSHG